ncbi:hypothetical protein FQA39_LY15600 [Lamprigera yunnana]|nr:hypothetical protein FQA39_LY15600 [Lamprigera yunnana]
MQEMPTTLKIEKEFQVGPMSILQDALNNHKQVLISCRNDKKLLCYVKAYDRHMNLILENVKEMWTELPRKGKGKHIVNKTSSQRFIPELLAVLYTYNNELYSSDDNVNFVPDDLESEESTDDDDGRGSSFALVLLFVSSCPFLIFVIAISSLIPPQAHVPTSTQLQLNLLHPQLVT